jgi:hypothetical protein
MSLSLERENKNMKRKRKFRIEKERKNPSDSVSDKKNCIHEEAGVFVAIYFAIRMNYD